MLNKDNLADYITGELKAVKHIHSKFPRGRANYRPSETQRSALELGRYLATCGVRPILAAIDGGFIRADAWAEKVNKADWEQLPALYDEAAKTIRSEFERTPTGDFFNKQADLGGGIKRTPAEAAILGAMRYLPAYRLQMFLYAKDCGVKNINSYNVWRGEDMPPELAAQMKAQQAASQAKK